MTEALAIHAASSSAARTEYAPPLHLPDPTKDAIFDFETSFQPPAYPTRYRQSVGCIRINDAWNLVAVAYPTSQIPTSRRGVGELLNCISQGSSIASTSVSLDAFQRVAPGLWPSDFDVVGHLPQRESGDYFTLFARSVIQAVYQRLARPEDLDEPDREADLVAPEDLIEIRMNAVRAARETKNLLRCSDEELSCAIGVSRASLYNWESGRRPHASKVARLFALDALLAALLHRLGNEGLQSWLHLGTPTRRTQLIRGDFDSVSTEAGDTVFSRVVIQQSAGFSAEPDLFLPGAKANASTTIVRRRNRVTLGDER